MNNKGFVLVESIIMFIVLISSLMLLYIAASNYMLKERKYSNYDDIVSIYEAYYIKEALNQYSNIDSMKHSLLTGYGYGRIIGEDISNFFVDEISTSTFYVLADKLHLHQIYLTSDINSLKTCAKKIDEDANCEKTFMDEEFRSYINSINLGNINNDYYLLLEFRVNASGDSCTTDEICFSRYTWVALW